MATACALQDHFREQGEDEAAAAKRAAAISNWTFDGTLGVQPESPFTKEEAAAIAEAWLLINPGFQELAVQTARMEAVAKFGLDDGRVTEPAPVLAWFGKSYPRAPSPESYPGLVTRQIQTLSEEAQASLRRWMNSKRR
ncbi:MAG: hypothetical protein KGN77_04315 [Xanthomonadaceae bacterium]|nr:hypothetical protein [Xanthomonadaceae bacterium]MDE1964552.1 hypothetical protein [Xanthomonadaceae bacterium]